MQLTGPITALITPFRDDEELDIPAFENLIDWQIAEGIRGIVPCGTTGESPTLEPSEYAQLFRAAVQVADRRVPVIAGTGSNNTRTAIRLSHLAQQAGADALLQVVPCYNKPTQAGLREHFRRIHDATDLPIILYNVPGRTVVSMDIETQAALAELPRIVGIKDATGNLARVDSTILTCKTGFTQLTGEDANVLEFMQKGGHGVISVTSNIAPGLCARLFNAHAGSNTAGAARIDGSLQPLHKAMFVETSPGPVKYAASLLGICKPDMRCPMVPISPESKRAVETELRRLGLVAAPRRLNAG